MTKYKINPNPDCELNITRYRAHVHNEGYRVSYSHFFRFCITHMYFYKSKLCSLEKNRKIN